MHPRLQRYIPSRETTTLIMLLWRFKIMRNWKQRNAKQPKGRGADGH